MTTKQYRERRAAKQCVYCCAPSPDRAACARCRKRDNDAQAKRRAERREAQLCTYCSEPTNGTAMCQGCRDYFNDRGRDRYVPVAVDCRKVGLSRRWPDRYLGDQAIAQLPRAGGERTRRAA